MKQKGKKQKRYVDNSRNNYKPLVIELYFSNTKNYNSKNSRKSFLISCQLMFS